MTYTHDAADNRTRLVMSLSTGNRPPMANPDGFPYRIGVTNGQTINIRVRDNDTDPDNDPLTVTHVTAGAKGTTSLGPDGASVIYASTPGQFGDDEFTYTISDGRGGTAVGNVYVISTVGAPIANPVSASVPHNSVNNTIPLNITGTPTSVAVASAATKGVATASGIGIKYTPYTGQSGTDTFTYTATNTGGTSAPALVTVSIAPAPPPVPVASPATMTVAANSTNNPLTPSVSGIYTSVDLYSINSSHGTVTGSATTLYYTPTPGYWGPAWFDYVAYNSSGRSNIARVDVNITAPPLPSVQASLSGTSFKRFITIGYSDSSVPLNITCTGGGGSGSGYTYYWYRESGDSVTTISSSTAQTVVWTRGPYPIGGPYPSTWRCRVTDSLGNQALSDPVYVEATVNQGGGGPID
ncbi:Ig-like domain-containing protein [Phenylobacterium sp.]|uniref:Ig-like domain-containing protein n=1 Tax=Phenylobacterium sp. TaxID=1871053 RepID=UPI00289AD75F|nr:Ig-like domain-containing protein [Phenylobacterium sp.]